jgi:hypothetical protein
MNRKLILWFGLFSLLLAGCSGGNQPLRIAAVPAQSTASYHAYLMIETPDTDAAARRANQIATDFGGYIVSQRLTTPSGQRMLVLEISVPASQNAPLRTALAHLGTVIEEWKTSDQSNSPLRIYPEPDSTIELYLCQSRYNLLPASTEGWDPRRTVAQAFAVFQTVFSFVVDLLIWVTIVIGPFVLVGWTIWMLVQRYRRTSGQPRPPDAR